MDNTALILANLTPEDDRRFHAARISYSGSTGEGAKPESYNGLGPYIATYASQLHHAVKAMGWEKFSIEASAGQWVVRCESREPTEMSLQHLIETVEAELSAAKSEICAPVDNRLIDIGETLLKAIKVIVRNRVDLTSSIPNKF